MVYMRTHIEDGEELPSVVDVFWRLVLEQETGMGLEMETLLVPLTKVQYTHSYHTSEQST